MVESKERLWQIDALRGIAIVLMIAFHLLFDLSYFHGLVLDLSGGALLILARSALCIFLLLVGISLSLSYNRSSKAMNSSQLTVKYLKRGATIFGLGLIITAVTWLAFPESFIFFGVLHLIGLSIILARPFLSKTWLNLVLGIAVILAGLLLNMQPPAYTFDFTPLLPWFGLVLFGLFISNVLRLHKKKPGLGPNAFSRFLAFIGRHSLLIYFLHQPILIAVVLLV